MRTTARTGSQGASRHRSPGGTRQEERDQQKWISTPRRTAEQEEQAGIRPSRGGAGFTWSKRPGPHEEQQKKKNTERGALRPTRNETGALGSCCSWMTNGRWGSTRGRDRRDGLRAIQQWDQGTHNEQDRLAESIAKDADAIFGCWPMLRAVFDEEAERGGGMTVARRAEFLELIRRRLRPGADAEDTLTDEEAIRQWDQGSLATQLRLEQSMRDEWTARQAARRRRVLRACKDSQLLLEDKATSRFKWDVADEYHRRTSLATKGPAEGGDSSDGAPPELIHSSEVGRAEPGAGRSRQGELRRKNTRESAEMEGVRTKRTRLAGGEGHFDGGGDSQGLIRSEIAEIAQGLI